MMLSMCRVQVRLGDHHNGDEKAVQVIAIGTIISHEKYNVWPHGNDIAILKLEQKVQINGKVVTFFIHQVNVVVVVKVVSTSVVVVNLAGDKCGRVVIFLKCSHVVQ